MPQTKEAISHAQAAGVPMIFAINKIDKPGASADKIREQLSAMNILVEDWGGTFQCQEISAKQNLNIEELLEKVLLEAEMLNLKANPAKPTCWFKPERSELEMFCWLGDITVVFEQCMTRKELQ
jgi:translation initiation factor IF-2